MLDFLYTIGGYFISIVDTWVGKVLASLGLGYMSFTGIRTLVDQVSGDALQRIQSLSPVALQLAGVLQIGTCIHIMVSALIVKITLKGISSDTLTKFITGVRS